MTKTIKKILVCDDDEGILEVLKIVLENNNFQVKEVNSGKAIQKRVEEYKPDLVLLDFWMPGIKGREIIKLLKNDVQTKNIPILLLSAVNAGEKIAQESGADGFLSKPFDIMDLVKTVQKYTD